MTAGVWKKGKCWIWVVISRSLNISVCSSCSASGTVAWSRNTAESRRCQALYINWPSGHVKVTRSAKFLVGGGGVVHTHCSVFVQQGRCKVTGAMWPRPDHSHRCHSDCDQRWFSDSTAATRRKYQFFMELKCTTSLSGKNGFETRYKNTSCNQAGQITALTCRERTQNHCY